MEEALEQIGRDVPDVLLADIGLPGMSGIRLLKQRYPALPALVLTVYEDDERIFNALCAGACGYLLKSTPRARLLEGLPLPGVTNGI
jgi:DNA-binding NarL/FixJ family response regulator